MKKLLALPLLAFLMMGCATRAGRGNNNQGGGNGGSSGGSTDYGETITVDEMIEIVSKLADNGITDKEYTVTGVLGDSRYNSDHNSYNCYFQNHMKADSVPVYIYSGVLDSSISGDYTAENALAGKTVVVKGYLEKFVNSSNNTVTYEIPYLKSTLSPTGAAYSPTILSVK